MESNLKKYQWMLRLMGWFQIPMIGFLKPRILALNDDQIRLSIQLRRRSRNHFKSMYFGALAVGADIAAGMHVFYFCNQLGVKPSFAFKGVKATFDKRAETDVVFVCKEGKAIADLVAQAIKTKERHNQWVEVFALNTSNETVATFLMEISVKVK